MSTNTPRFTVIIPAYNRQQYLDEAVGSVLAQTWQDFEIIVVDDCSPVALTVPEDPRIRCIRSDRNQGKSAALNMALELAAGEIVAFLDDDDRWGARRLEHANFAHGLASVAICLNGRIEQPVAGEVGWPVIRLMESSEYSAKELLASMNGVSVLRAVCPSFDETFRASQDLEWGIRLQRVLDSVAMIESEDWLWRRHDGVRNLNGQRARLRASIRLLQLHSDHYSRHPEQRAYRLFRIGHYQLVEGDDSNALRSGLSSLLARPNRHGAGLVIRAVRSMARRASQRLSR